MQTNKKYGWLLLIYTIWSSLNYNPQLLIGLNSPHWGWIFSLLATVLILFFMRIRDKRNWKQKLGIHFSKNDFTVFILLTLLLLVLSYFTVDYVTKLEGYSFQPKILYFKTYAGSDYPLHYILANYIYYIPETFNEEILVGALLLMGIERRFIKLNRNFIAIFVALIFSLMHQALYRWSPVQSGDLLTTKTIFTLIFIGILRNALILKTRKITYSWAIHLSFNTIFFSGYFINEDIQKFPSEPELFNLIFGNNTMLLFCGILAFISMIWLNMDKSKITSREKE